MQREHLAKPMRRRSRIHETKEAMPPTMDGLLGARVEPLLGGDQAAQVHVHEQQSGEQGQGLGMVGAGPEVKVVLDIGGHGALDRFMAGEGAAAQRVVQFFEVQAQRRIRHGKRHQLFPSGAVPIDGVEPRLEAGPRPEHPRRSR